MAAALEQFHVLQDSVVRERFAVDQPDERRRLMLALGHDPDDVEDLEGVDRPQHDDQPDLALALVAAVVVATTAAIVVAAVPTKLALLFA